MKKERDEDLESNLTGDEEMVVGQDGLREFVKEF